MSSLARHQYKATDYPIEGSPARGAIESRTVQKKVRYYESLFSSMVQEEIPKGSPRSPRPSNPTLSPDVRHNENVPPPSNQPVPPPAVKSFRPVMKQSLSRPRASAAQDETTIRIQERAPRQLEREDSCSVYDEKLVEVEQEEEERRSVKVEPMETKNKRSRASMDTSPRLPLRAIPAKGYASPVKESHVPLPVPISPLSEKATESLLESSEESSSILVDEEAINGDLWGGIVTTMAERYCDHESTWHTFSSYSVQTTDTHSQLHLFNDEIIRSLDQESTLEEDQDVLPQICFSQRQRNEDIFAMYDQLEEELLESNQRLEDTCLELAGYRTQLYAALHQLAKNEYQMRLFEQQLLTSNSEKLEMENQVENQKILLSQQEQQALMRDIQLLRQEAELQKQHVQVLRTQIRQSICALPPARQSQYRSQLSVEDPFIECSIRLLDTEETSLQRLSVLEARLSTLSSRNDVQVSQEKKRKPHKTTKKSRKNPAEFLSPNKLFSPWRRKETPRRRAPSTKVPLWRRFSKRL